MSDSRVYEGLIGQENGAFSEYQRVSGPPVRSHKAATDGCSCSGRAAAIAVMLILTLCAAGVSGWSYYRLGSVGRRPVTSGCAFANFVLDSGAMPSCVGWPPRREPPCSLDSRTAAAFLPSTMHNNAIGPWKAVNDSSSRPPGSGEVGSTVDGCGIKLTREATHLTIGKSGLYQVSAQVTFTGDGGAGAAKLIWRVNNADWIAQAKTGAANGPTQTYLSAVRRLEAGQRVSLHMSQPYRTVGMEPAMTNILLSML